jgi:hypothetical protein
VASGQDYGWRDQSATAPPPGLTRSGIEHQQANVRMIIAIGHTVCDRARNAGRSQLQRKQKYKKQYLFHMDPLSFGIWHWKFTFCLKPSPTAETIPPSTTSFEKRKLSFPILDFMI